MPCLNEAETIAQCVSKAQAFLQLRGVSGEVLVADNGSTDGSQAIARRLGARVIDVPKRGYGSALIAGISAARGRYVVMGDADDSYDFSSLDVFLARLREGYELVMGNRFAGGIAPGAMPFLHRYLGNPVLSWIGRLFFGSPINDFHCGLRGFHAAAIRSLGLTSEGMEFASEMVVKASLKKLSVTEVPTTLSKDGRSRPPHLRTWRDGWRHLRFLLAFSPAWLFVYPGLTLLAAGLAATLWLLPGSRSIGPVTLDIHSMSFAVAGLICGLQAVIFGLGAYVLAERQGLAPIPRPAQTMITALSFERGLIGGGLLLMIGMGLAVTAVGQWIAVSGGALDPAVGMRTTLPAVGTLVAGTQVILGSFFLTVLRIMR